MGRVALFLEVADQRVLVVGAGAVAAVRIRRMRACGALVDVVSPQFGEEVLALVEQDSGIQCSRRKYLPSDLDGASLVLVCTDDLALQTSISSLAAARGLPCVAADAASGARASFAAQFERGSLAVAVGTSGKAPALAAHVRDLLARHIGSHYGAAAELLGELRQRARDHGLPARSRRELSKSALDAGLLEMLMEGDDVGAGRVLDQLLAVQVEAHSGQRSE